ncbi:hypothetical protein F4X33_12855 [Candidatus Poribacteria bacterium]|nr:hypothetical protein [Candidatus Poribacteria bacterium]
MEFSLETLINESGLRKNYIAECLGISEQSFCNKLKKRRRFRDAEITKLSRTLEVPERIIRRLCCNS